MGFNPNMPMKHVHSILTYFTTTCLAPNISWLLKAPSCEEEKEEGEEREGKKKRESISVSTFSLYFKSDHIAKPSSH